MPVAGIDSPADMPLPERLKQVQALMRDGDPRATKIYQTIGAYVGYGVAHFAAFYDLRHVLVLGRVTSGPGGDEIVRGAREVLDVEFPDFAGRITFHVPGEHDRRHGQAIAAASLPSLRR
jgi:predicted NBD/HSP70 family sugar kinase